MDVIRDWPHAIAHVDCDAFYASCEAARHPEFKGRPICVLSNHDAMVVAKSYDAKALGICTGTPVWEARKLAPDGLFLTPYFRYYGQISVQMFAILRRYSPLVEVCSIDEGFLDVAGMCRLHGGSWQGLADEIRDAVRREVGITVSVGISLTRTLAKMASEYHKPDGTTVVAAGDIDRFLSDLDVNDIPGIGRNRAAHLNKPGIRTALQFACTSESLMQRLLGRHGMLLRRELKGQSVLRLEQVPPLAKSMAKTASMGRVTASRRVVASYLSYHAMRLVADLVARQLQAERLYLFLTLESSERHGLEVRPAVATNSLQRINAAVHQAFESLYVYDQRYRGCGIVATHLRRESMGQVDLFGQVKEDDRQRGLMRTVNAINARFGSQTISTVQVAAVAGRRITAQKKMTGRGKSPRFCYPLIQAG